MQHRGLREKGADNVNNRAKYQPGYVNTMADSKAAHCTAEARRGNAEEGWMKLLDEAHREVLKRHQQHVAALFSTAGGVDNLLAGAVLQVHCLATDLSRPHSTAS